ncbi:MAG: GntR family transcriptional regulator [Oscillospiraceae bacterium]|nr:GntR family transcriptional regulator [Oscillospiraceae bacterium]
MDIFISNTSGQPIYEQIVSQVKDKILKGQLKAEEPLPSIRLLARELRISVITTKRAYEELERAGFIVTMAGKGSYVAPRDPGVMREEHLRRVEKYLSGAVEEARIGGVTKEELMEMLELLCQEND